MKLIDSQQNEQQYQLLNKSKMKNSLQLEIQTKIKRANRFLTAKQYTQACQHYTQGLEMYHENRRYNQSVSEQFQALLYSLRGNAYSLNMKAEQAEEDFQKSIQINPYNAVTFSRRAKHLMKQKRYSQAIQNIDLALLYDPQNLSYVSLLNSIQNFANALKDNSERQHITQLVSSVKQRLNAKPPTQSESDQDGQEQILNFSNLRLIDRQSIRMSPTKISKLQKRQSIIQFKEDQILQYNIDQNQQSEKQDEQVEPQDSNQFSTENIQKKLSLQQEQLKQLQVEQEEIRKSSAKISQHIILTKSHSYSRKSILRKSMGGDVQNMIFISTPGDKFNLKKRSSISASSIKDIDGKVVDPQVQTIKFKPRPSLSGFSKISNQMKKIQQQQSQYEKQNLSKTTPNLCKNNSRKSCLRMSQKFSADDNIEELSKTELSKTAPVGKKFLKRKSSNFQNIKSIDGQYVKKSSQDADQLQNPPVNIKIETSSDDQNNEHDIFGSVKNRQVLQVCQNTEQVSSETLSRLSKKKSILRKDSFLTCSMMSLKNQHKKSVMFNRQQ